MSLQEKKKEIQKMAVPNLHKIQGLSKVLSGEKEVDPNEGYHKLVYMNGQTKTSKTPGQILCDMQYRERGTWSQEEEKLLDIRITNQAYCKLIYQQKREVMENEFYKHPERYTSDPRIIKHAHEVSAAGSSSRFINFTINIKPEAQGDFGRIKKQIEKATTKTWIKRWICSYEQRGLIGTPEFGTGIHINLLIEKTDKHMSKKASKCWEEMKNTFKHLISFDGWNDKKLLNMSYNTDPENFLNYVKGIKSDPEKLPLVESDRVWRKSLGIPDVIGNWFTESDTGILVRSDSKIPLTNDQN